MRGADLLVRALSKAGVERLFTLSGNQIMPVFDACLDEHVELIHVRHEAAAVHMADAWGRLTDEPGIALVTAGPGHANALSALFVALAAESPLVLFSGQAPQSQQGQSAFQEMAQAEMAGHVTKASWTANDPAELGHDVARAIRMAKSGRPGPVHVSLPVDLLQAVVDDSSKLMPQPDDFFPVLSLLDAQIADRVLTALAQASRPLILAGPSMIRGSGIEVLGELADRTHVPVIGMEGPRGTIDPSLGAFAEVLAQADLIVLLGKQLDFTLRFGDAPHINPNCRFIQIDPERRILEQTDRVSSRLLAAELADSIPAAQRLAQRAAQQPWPNRDWFDEVQSAVAYQPPQWATIRSPAEGPLHAVDVCRAVRQSLDGEDEAVLISDGGEFGQWAQAYLTLPHRLINGPSGAIGSAIPFALASRLAFPESRIVTMLGDGTFGFHALEFDTAVRYKLPFVAVVGNDARWNAEHQIQLRDYGPKRLIGCELLPTRYDEIAKALGGHGENVTKPSELTPALQRAFESNLPACVNVSIASHAAPQTAR